MVGLLGHGADEIARGAGRLEPAEAQVSYLCHVVACSHPRPGRNGLACSAVFSDQALTPFLVRLRTDLPGLEILDAHTHIGFNDPDGMRCAPETLLEALELAGNRAVVFPMHEPEGYPKANDWVREEADRSEGRLVPFARLDPRDDPVAEGERSLDAGAKGLKLHPRAEEFAMDEPGVEPIVALAQERKVPLIVHAGRGIPALGRHVVELCRQPPRGQRDPRPRRDLRPGLDLARRARAPQPLLRHLVVERRRPARADVAGAPGPGPAGLRRALRQPHDGRRPVPALRASGRPGRGGGEGDRRRSDGTPAGAARSRSTWVRRATRRPAATCCSTGSGPSSPTPPARRCRGSTPPRPSTWRGWPARSATRRPRRRCAKRCSPCWRTRRTCRPTPTGPSRFMPVLPRLILAGLLVRTPDVPLPGVETPVDVAARPKGTA